MVAISRIVCPIDFSKNSRHALDHAVALAKWYEAHLTVLHIGPQPVRVPLVGVPGEMAELPSLEPDAIANDLRRFCGDLPSSPAGPATIDVKHGDAARAIVSGAEGADLVVMATHGRGGLQRLLLGSVTERVLRTTRTPVLTVPPPVKHLSSAHYRTILCRVEFSATSRRGLSYALSLALETNARLILLHVIEGSSDQLAVDEMVHLSVRECDLFLEEHAFDRLAAIVPEPARAWCRSDPRIVRGKAYKQIVRIASEEGAELIVMGVHGRRVFHPGVFASTIPHVIREAGCPVVTLRS